MTINFSPKSITPNDLIKVNKVLKSGWLTHGKYTKLFESEFCKFTKARYSTTVSSCTAGLHLSCLALGIKKNDEVIVTSMSHTATSHVVEYLGAKPIFVDIENITGNINSDLILSKINKKTKALIIVHMAGTPCDMNKIIKICKKYKIGLIEDCAHALGASINGKHLGNYGISGCFSFYPTKHITTGEGGMVISNNRKFIEKIKLLKAFGIDTDLKNRKIPGLYNVKFLGFNYRMTDFQAAIGYLQLKRFKKNLSIRIKNAKLYCRLLRNSKIRLDKFNKNSSYFVFQIFIKNRDALIKKLKENNIGCSIHYATPLPLLSYYQKKYYLKKKNFINSIYYSRSVISLPVHHQISKNDIYKISNLILRHLKD